MESHGEVGRVHISKELRDELGSGFSVEARGEIEVKGKGLMETFFLLEENGAPEDPVFLQARPFAHHRPGIRKFFFSESQTIEIPRYPGQETRAFQR